jgi:hypothetical protein
MAHFRGIACALLVAAGVASVPVANAASWRPAGSISAPEGTDRTFVTDFGTDRTGALTVLYRGRDFNGGWGPMRLRDRPFGGPIGLVNLYDKHVLGGFAYADLEVAPNGRQLLAYIDADARGRYEVVAASRRRAGAKWGRPRVVGKGRVRVDEGGIAAPSDLKVALASSGEAVIAWQDGATLSTAERTARAGRFGAPVRFGGRRLDALEMDAHGNALLVAIGKEAVLAMRRPAGGEFGAAQSLATADARPDGFAWLAVTGSGEAVLAWTELRQDDPDPAESTNNSVAAATGSTTAGFGSVRRLTESDVFYPQVAISRGLTAIAWGEVPFGRTVGAFGRTGRPVDELQTHVLAPSGSSLELGLGGGLVVARGRATVLFDQAGSRGGGSPLRVRQVTGGGRLLSEPQTLTRLTDNLGTRLTDPGIALSRSGRPYVAWPADDNRIEVARASLKSGRFGPPQRIHVRPGYDQLRLIPTRGDAMLLAYVRHAWHLLAYGN